MWLVLSSQKFYLRYIQLRRLRWNKGFTTYQITQNAHTQKLKESTHVPINRLWNFIQVHMYVHVLITVAKIHKPHCTYAWSKSVCAVYNKQWSSGSNIIF